ncbi:MAG: flagellar motor protein MotB, partial [Terriglobales bacterium]
MKQTLAPSPFIRAISVSAALVLSFGLAACGHKAVPPPPPPAPPAATANAPTITLQASPTAIDTGASSTLTWTSTDAVKVELNGTAVNLNGDQPVSPSESTDYQAVATSADGQTANAAVRITVSQPPPPQQPPTPVVNNEGTFNEDVKDAFFDYDRSDIRPDAQQVLQQDAS